MIMKLDFLRCLPDYNMFLSLYLDRLWPFRRRLWPKGYEDLYMQGSRQKRETQTRDEGSQRKKKQVRPFCNGIHNLGIHV